MNKISIYIINFLKIYLTNSHYSVLFYRYILRKNIILKIIFGI